MDLYGLCILTNTLKQTLVASIYSRYISVNILLFSIALNTINLSCYHIYLIYWTTTMSVVLYWILLSTENDKITYPAGTVMSKINMTIWICWYNNCFVSIFMICNQYHVRFVKICMLIFNLTSLIYHRLFKICSLHFRISFTKLFFELLESF